VHARREHRAHQRLGAQYSVRVVTLLGQEIILSGCRMGF
jgi:hypothetical protein